MGEASRDTNRPQPALDNITGSLTIAVSEYRKVLTLTGTERKRLNEAMDDFICEVERVKIAHQRCLERTNPANQQFGMVPPGH